MRFPEYDDLDAVAIAALVRAGKVSPQEVLEAAIERIERRNPALNAVVHRLYTRARERAGQLPDGPLKGVPFLFKDLKLQLKGTPTTNSTRLDRQVVSERSSLLALRYEEAGLQVVGKTNTPEFGIMGITEPETRGPCRNPWNVDHTPGGSSGGSAAAVAARMVPVAHGGDGGGSIRIPAAACGLFGLKPTRGRVTMAPFSGEAWGGFVQEHVLARSVRDSALLLDVAGEQPPGEPYGVPRKVRPFVQEVGEKPGALRVAWSAQSLYADGVDGECQTAAEETAHRLESLGHSVEEARPDFDRVTLIRAYFLTVATGVAWFCETTAARHGRRPKAADFEPATWMLALIGWKTSAPELLAAQVDMQRAARRIADFFQRYDLFVLPTLAKLPARIGELAIQPTERAQMALVRALPVKRLLQRVLEKMSSGKLAWTPNTQLFNQTGQPAASVPSGFSKSGLPLGTQLVSRFGDEATLFRVAAQLEEAHPWIGQKPPLLAAAES